MKLRTKLLLGVGLLLFAMVIVMYILPTLFVRKDVYEAADEIHTLLVQERQKLTLSQKIWLDNELLHTVQNINSMLFMLYEEPALSKTLAFTKDNSIQNVWEGVARVAGYDPAIGFIQAHSSEADQTVVVAPYLADWHPIEKIRDHNGMVFIGMRGKQPIYVGVPLPKELQSESGYTLYALIEAQKVAEEKQELLKALAEVNAEFSSIEEDSSSYLWALKMDMIRTVTPLILEGFLIEHSEKKFFPEGIGRLNTSGSGMALLTDEIFQTKPLFEDKHYYETHPPKPGEPPIAQGSVFVTKPDGNHAFIGNTLLVENTFLTMGVPFHRIVKQLALSANHTFLLSISGKYWFGYEGDGSKVPATKIDEIIKSSTFDQDQGIFHLGDEPYSYSKISSLDEGGIVFYEIHPLEGDTSIIATLLTLENNLSNRISLQLSLISLGTMILVLLFIGRIGLTIIYPITKLAKATEDVVAGRYEEVVLPEVGKRKDEVAILTRAFGDMVEGLEEREKIRGVLDKVVSKDIADEILRTQIHLGGEDRVVTMLFSDIRGFSEMTENATPQKTIQMLNGCMTKISQVIEGEGGIIDKYVGDEVMAIFGAPTIHPDHALRAVSSGILMIETLKLWNQERLKEGEVVIEIGIGIHSGLVVAGNMGAEDRLNYTVLGANVNLAARLCDVAMPNQLIISEATLSEPNVEESFLVKPLDPISLKGFKEPVSIYEVVGFKWDES